ncbi:MAG: energy transducer TonB [Bacteroidales bacterium]|nr:energy transducer TonB [Candidatus Physcousia equi]
MKKLLTLSLMCLVAIVVSAQKNEFPVPDKIAKYPGGNDAMARFLQENLQYPKSSQMERKEGRVLVSFVVNRDGTIQNPTITESPDDALAQEALRVVRLMPRWKPAELSGSPVKMRFTLPINFTLPSKEYEKMAESILSKASFGGTENPRGLYRLQKTAFEDGRPDLITPYRQYKYCTDTNTAQIITQQSDKNEFSVLIGEPREGVLNYTGKAYEDGDTTKARIYDSNGTSFKLKWFQDEAEDVPYYPWHTYSIEYYDNSIGVEPELSHICDLLSMKYSNESKNPFIGCWRCLGMPTKMEGLEVLMLPKEDTYKVYDETNYLTLYNLDIKRIGAFAILKPIKYTTKNKASSKKSELSDYCGLIEDFPSEVTWLSKDCFKQSYTNEAGETITLIWKRSGLPRTIQHLVGTNIPTTTLHNPLPTLFR